jgi:hypothetical protein
MIRRNILLRTLRLRSITTRTPTSARRLTIQRATPLIFQCSKRVITVPRIQNRFMTSTVAATPRSPTEGDAGGSELPTISTGFVGLSWASPDMSDVVGLCRASQRFKGLKDFMNRTRPAEFDLVGRYRVLTGFAELAELSLTLSDVVELQLTM